MSDLHLHVKTEYFEAIKRGEKTEEYRLHNRYWQRRFYSCQINPNTWCVINRWDQRYDRVLIYNAYKPATEENVLTFPWRGFETKTITHPHFGPKPVMVFAIKLEK